MRACTEDEQGPRPCRARQQRSPQAFMGALMEGPVQEGRLPQGAHSRPWQVGEGGWRGHRTAGSTVWGAPPRTGAPGVPVRRPGSPDPDAGSLRVGARGWGAPKGLVQSRALGSGAPSPPRDFDQICVQLVPKRRQGGGGGADAGPAGQWAWLSGEARPPSGRPGLPAAPAPPCQWDGPPQRCEDNRQSCTELPLHRGWVPPAWRSGQGAEGGWVLGGQPQACPCVHIRGHCASSQHEPSAGAKAPGVGLATCGSHPGPLPATRAITSAWTLCGVLPHPQPSSQRAGCEGVHTRACVCQRELRVCVGEAGPCTWRGIPRWGLAGNGWPCLGRWLGWPLGTSPQSWHAQSAVPTGRVEGALPALSWS